MGDDKAQEAEITAPDLPTEEKSTEGTEPQLPDGVNERTAEQFEKLKKHNQELKEQLEKVNSAPKQSVLESLRPADNYPNVSQAQANEIQDQLIDEQGFVDPNLLNQKLSMAEKTAREAIQAAQQAQQQLRNFEETQQTQQLYSKYPQLNPNGGQFDPQFYNRVRNELIGQMMQGKQNAIEAADAVSQAFTNSQQEKAQEQEDISLKQQASSNLGTSQGASSPVDHDWLVEETRKGNENAIAERLKRINS